jgi:hypothetical protein
MTLGRLLTPVAVLLTVGAAADVVRADETPATAQAQNTNEVPATAFAALVRAEAAYAYGDMAQVVDAARPVAEGTLPSTVGQRARALRFLGIGLFLTNRALGAENAFAELLRIDPTARLDPTTARPEVVVFFENIRHQQAVRERASRPFIWNLLPPGGQFQNDDTVKGWIVGGVEFAAIATVVAGRLISYSWLGPHYVYGKDGSHNNDERNLRIVEWVSVGVLGAAYLYGVIDGIVHYYRPPEESSGSLSLLIFPAGGGLRLTF